MKGFVFDLDNTLFDRYATLTKIITDNFERIRPYINPAYDLPAALSHLLYTESLFITVDNWRGVYKHLVEEHFFNADNLPDYKKAISFIRETFQVTAVNFPFTAELLTQIREKGYKLGIITNGADALQRRKIELLGIGDYFDVIVTSGGYTAEMCGDTSSSLYEKPNPSIFHHTAKLLGVPCDQLYYVGDNPTNDIRGAVAAGYVPIWIRSRSPWPFENKLMPKLNYRSIEGLKELL